MGFASYPQVRVSFFTEQGNIAASTKLLDTRDKDQILSVQTSKDFNQPAGTFTVVLTAETIGGTRFRSIPGTGGQVFGRDKAGQVTGRAEVASEVSPQSANGWKDWLRPGDLVVIEMGPDRPQPEGTYYAQNYARDVGGKAEIVMIGSIDDIRSTMTIGRDGRPSRAVVVTGRDFGKYLIDDQSWFHAWWDPIGAYLGFLGDIVTEFPKVRLGDLNPGGLMHVILGAWLFKQFDVEFDVTERGSVRKPGQKKLSQILRYVFDNTAPTIPFAQSWIHHEGAPWHLFQEIQGAPWYVMHLDTRRRKDIEALHAYTRPGQRIDSQAPVVWNTDLSNFDTQVCFLYYRNPWSNRHSDDWTSLPTRVVTSEDVVSEDLGRSNEEVFNRWHVIAEAVGLDRVVKAGLNALREPSLEKRFGIRPRTLKSPFVTSSPDATLITLIKQQTEQARDWDLHALDFLNGSMTIKGMAAVKTGDRLHYVPHGVKATEGIDFYVEGVRQSFEQFSGWQTTLQLTRGQVHRDRGELLFATNGGAVTNPDAMHFVGR